MRCTSFPQPRCRPATAPLRERFGIASIDLMRAASSAVAAFARKQFPQAHRVTVLAGTGNNGGDGMMAAWLLAEAGLDVTTLLLGAPEKLAGDAASRGANSTSRCAARFTAVTSAQELA